jgi:group I intron endonuclease
MGYIYRIINNINGKTYIGCSENYEKRWKDHIATLNRDGGCPALKSAILKHGLENFKFEVMIICFDEDMEFYEPAYIKKYDTMIPNGYNISAGGKATYGFQGKSHSDETKKKIGESTKKRFEDPNEREKHRQQAIITYKNGGDEIKKRISEAVRASPVFQLAKENKLVGARKTKNTEETKKKISDSVKKLYQSKDFVDKHKAGIIKALAKPIIQYDLDGNIIKEYVSILETERQTKISHTSIYKCLYGITKQTRGFIFKFKNN